MRWLIVLLLLAIAACVPASEHEPARDEIVIGSKKFTESVILGEMAQIRIAETGHAITHRRELGGSRILWDSLRAGEIDVYPEYTGTLRYEILSDQKLTSDSELSAALARHGIAMSAPLGFSNGYALAMRKDRAEEFGIQSISDLMHFGELDVAVSNEFVARADGWRALSQAYDLGGLQVRGIDHDLAYRALDAGQIDVTDAYTTDAEIAAYELKLLQDDRAFFPRYDAVFLYREGLPADAVNELAMLEGRINETRMRELNRMVRIDGVSEREAAASAVGQPDSARSSSDGANTGPWRSILDRTLEHLALVAAALAGAVALAIPLGILAARNRRLGSIVISLTGILQTIPSLALFVILIPVFGIGAAPTIAALFLYSLLPIVRNTHAGLTGISPALIDSADALGLSRTARLKRIELPLAMPTIMAGIRTAAVIAVGLATLGAIIGAGGYGQPILTGIRLNDMGLVMSGAIPAALMALAIEAIFHLIQRAVTPRGLRLQAGRA